MQFTTTETWQEGDEPSINLECENSIVVNALVNYLYTSGLPSAMIYSEVSLRAPDFEFANTIHLLVQLGTAADRYTVNGLLDLAAAELQKWLDGAASIMKHRFTSSFLQSLIDDVFKNTAPKSAVRSTVKIHLLHHHFATLFKDAGLRNAVFRHQRLMFELLECWAAMMEPTQSPCCRLPTAKLLIEEPCSASGQQNRSGHYKRLKVVQSFPPINTCTITEAGRSFVDISSLR